MVTKSIATFYTIKMLSINQKLYTITLSSSFINEAQAPHKICSSSMWNRYKIFNYVYITFDIRLAANTEGQLFFDVQQMYCNNG